MQLTWTQSPALDMVSITETLAAMLDGHSDFLIVVPDSAAWPKLEADEAAMMIIMPNLYKIYAFNMDSVAVAVSPNI